MFCNHFGCDLSYLVLHILFYNFLYQYISQGLEINCKLLVLFSVFLFFYQQLKEGFLLPARPGDVGSFLRHPQQLPEDICHSESCFPAAAAGGTGIHPLGRQLEKYKNVREKAVQGMMSGCPWRY